MDSPRGSLLEGKHTYSQQLERAEGGLEGQREMRLGWGGSLGSLIYKQRDSIPP